jgi:hypothetical protein
MSVESYKVGCCHGHLGIIMTNEEYLAIAVDVVPVHNNPGPSAAVVAGMTAAVIAETTRLHRDGGHKCITLITTQIRLLRS